MDKIKILNRQKSVHKSRSEHKNILNDINAKLTPFLAWLRTQNKLSMLTFIICFDERPTVRAASAPIRKYRRRRAWGRRSERRPFGVHRVGRRHSECWLPTGHWPRGSRTLVDGTHAQLGGAAVVRPECGVCRVIVCTEDPAGNGDRSSGPTGDGGRNENRTRKAAAAAAESRDTESDVIVQRREPRSSKSRLSRPKADRTNEV